MECATCSAAASLTCAQCNVAHYCSTDCQKADWKEHKLMCNLDSVVRRAGVLVQKFFFVWREHTFTDIINCINDKGKRLVIHYRLRSQCTIQVFPNSMANAKTKKMILAAEQQGQYLAHFHRLLAKMLKDTSVTIQEVALFIKEPTKKASPAPPWVQVQPTPDGFVLHDLLQVSCDKLQQKWYLDATGPQHNIFRPCLESKKYHAKCGAFDQPETVITAGHSSEKFKETAELPGAVGLARQGEGEGFEAMENAVSAWCKDTENTLSKVLRLDNNEYAKVEENLLAAVIKALKYFAALHDQNVQWQQIWKNSAILCPYELRLAMGIDAKYRRLTNENNMIDRGCFDGGDDELDQGQTETSRSTEEA